MQRALFRTQDLSQVKKYCCRTWSKILRNKVSIQEFIFAKEVKMGTYRYVRGNSRILSYNKCTLLSEKGPPPPGVAVAARRMLGDPNDEPQYGERVAYIISRGDPHKRLVERAVTPEEFLANSWVDPRFYVGLFTIPLATCTSMLHITLKRFSSLHLNAFSTSLVQMCGLGTKKCQKRLRSISGIHCYLPQRSLQ